MTSIQNRDIYVIPDFRKRERERERDSETDSPYVIYHGMQMFHVLVNIKCLSVNKCPGERFQRNVWERGK